MKILLLGASGFIGNACFDFFSTDNEVIGVDIFDYHSKGIITDNDFSVTRKLITETKFDVIINCAGTANIQESFINTAKDFYSNTVFVQNVLELIKNENKNAKFINLSSAAVYGNPDLLPISETATTKPLSPYGFHKLLSEQIVKEYSSMFNLNALSVRIFSAYGIGMKKQLFFDLYSKFQANDKVIQLSGTGNESRDFIYVSDIVASLDLLINKGSFNGEVYNLASGEESFINSTVQLFAEIINYKGEVIYSNSQFDGYPLNWRADTSKLKTIGFLPKINLKEGLKLYADWIKINSK